jgi:hypothetical protein
MAAIELDLSDVVIDAADVSGDIEQTLADIAEAIGAKTIEFLRALTSEMRPPVKAGAPWRHAHWGHWADRSSQLALGYRYEVNRTVDGVELVLINGTEYAMALEAHDGYMVLTGVTDPGGPAEVKLREAVAILAPGWEVR